MSPRLRGAARNATWSLAVAASFTAGRASQARWTNLVEDAGLAVMIATVLWCMWVLRAESRRDEHEFRELMRSIEREQDRGGKS